MARDSVFVDLFSKPCNQLELLKSFNDVICVTEAAQAWVASTCFVRKMSCFFAGFVIY